MGWELTIESDPVALRWLANNTQHSSPRVVPVGDVHRLEWDGLEALSDATVVQAAALEQLAQIAGSASTLLGRRVELRLIDTSFRRSDGKRVVFIECESQATASALAEMEVTDRDGHTKHEPHHTLIERTLALAKIDAEMAKILRLASGSLESWADLYRLYELVESVAGGSAALAALSATSRERLSRFARSANSPTLSGDGARHGVQRGSAPAKAMTLSEAVELVRHLSRCVLLARLERLHANREPSATARDADVD